MRAEPTLDATIHEALSGSRRALARLLTLLESQPSAAPAIVGQLWPRAGAAHIVGITGAPGVGKSSLVSPLAQAYRSLDLTVAIVAVDPTSPYSGGALLGDRIRMSALSGDPGAFVRSMASRGGEGGLARTTADVLTVLDACGFERILVETVGVGQGDVAVSELAHTTVVVQAPHMGDEVQALKAGILESAHVLAVNKADLDGAQRAAHLLEATLGLSADVAPAGMRSWRPPVILTVATTGEGLDELVGEIERHRLYLAAHGPGRATRARLDKRVEMIVLDQLARELGDWMAAPQIAPLLERLARRETDPYSVAQAVRAALSGRG